MADLLIDSDVFIDHLRGAHRLRAGNDHIAYSVVTRAELFAGRQVEETRVAQLLAPFEEVVVDRLIAERAGRIRREGKVRTPDALIAATALEHGLVLVTRNLRDFAGIPGLRVQLPK